MKTTVIRCAAASRGRQRFRPSWLSPGLSSHQQLDAGIAARQHAGRKALKKSKRPFDNYFRTQFRFSPRVQLPVTDNSGVLSSYNAVRMMTDPTRSWGTPWDRHGSGATMRRRRQDVLEAAPTQFGEDACDRVVEQLLEIRFAWDREDGVLCTSLVPNSLYGGCAHCRPYLAEVADGTLTSSTALAPSGNGDAGRDGADDAESVMIAGVPVRIQRRTPVVHRYQGQPKRPHASSQLGFSGLETVPSVVLDVSHGPFVTSPSAPLMTLRWKGESHEAVTAQRTLHLLRQVRAVPVVGLAPRSSLLLLKALATVEVEEPALAVSLAIAMGENYNGYSHVECLEVLRCLRRLAFVRGLPDLSTPDINALALSVAGRDARVPALYTEAALTESMLSRYLHDAAPFLIGKVWSRLPEQSRHLLERGYFLDWFDLVRLAIAAAGPLHLPERLPNASTEAPYAAKYLFFHHTLGLKKRALRAMVAGMRTAAPAVASSPLSTAPQHTMPASVQPGDASAAPPAQFVDEERETVDKPLTLWLCASLLVRIVAEALGDVVQHVGDGLHQHAALASERAEAQASRETLKEAEAEAEGEGEAGPAPQPTPPSFSQKLHRPYPRFRNGGYQQIGCLKPKRVRVRLLPFEAFPRVAQCLSTPFAAVTRRVEERQRRRGADRFPSSSPPPPREPSPSASSAGAVAASPAPCGATAPEHRVLQSSFAAVLAESPQMVGQIERTCAALRWSTMVLQACRELVRDLPAAPAPPVAVSAIASERGGWARETVSMEVRHALCYRYVRSAVQAHMDAIFTFIPWGEVESTWEPMLAEGEDAAEAEPEDRAQQPAVPQSTVAGEKAKIEGVLTADALEGLMVAGTTQQPGSGARDSSDATPPLSEAEQLARSMMAELRESLEEFQVAVAEVLDAHERFFGGAKPATESATPVQ